MMETTTRIDTPARPPARDFVPYLDGWRGLAILSVLVGHFGVDLGLGWLGIFGVVLFFALSGYLMGGLLFIKRVPLPDFFARRVTRVVPTFWLFIACMVFAAPALGWRAPGLQEVLSTLFFLRTYLPQDMSIFSNGWAIGHIWSLNVEEHSYLLLGMVALLIRRLDRERAAPLLLVLTGAALVAIGLSYVVAPPAGASPWRLRSEVAGFAIVAAAAWRVVLQGRRPVGSGWMRLLMLGAMACAVYYYARLRYLEAWFWAGPLCLAFVINHLHHAPQVVLAALSSGLLRWFGRCSFSLYLWQQPFFVAANEGRLHPLVALVLALGCASLSYYAFENPARIWLNRRWEARRSAALARGAGAPPPAIRSPYSADS